MFTRKLEPFQEPNAGRSYANALDESRSKSPQYPSITAQDGAALHKLHQCEPYLATFEGVGQLKIIGEKV